jgi:hypothetical protein
MERKGFSAAVPQTSVLQLREALAADPAGYLPWVMSMVLCAAGRGGSPQPRCYGVVLAARERPAGSHPWSARVSVMAELSRYEPPRRRFAHAR